MAIQEKPLRIFDDSGKLLGVFVPACMWADIEPLIPDKSPPDPLTQEDLSGFNEFMQAWDFRYPYDPAVSCPRCGSFCADWRNDGNGAFSLVSANFSGLLVFRCHCCNAAIRHKYFKDHMTVESTPGDGS